uniref:Uncharacterized protein n=1 Tax=Picea sitchensis TaxID=3332 RepID=D5A9W7_PICSI|nr:unknown [Picea sitchensis]
MAKNHFMFPKLNASYDVVMIFLLVVSSQLISAALGIRNFNSSDNMQKQRLLDGLSAATVMYSANKNGQPDGFKADVTATNLDPNFTSKRMVPNGSDPLHNR